MRATHMVQTVFVVLFLSLLPVSAFSTTLEATYAPEETMIARVEGALVSPPQATQIELRRGHVLVPFEHGVGLLGTTTYVWGRAPRTPGNYTLILNNVQALVEGASQTFMHQQNFSVSGEIAPYAVQPGALSTDEDVIFTITSFSEQEQTIKVSHPVPHQLVLVPGKTMYAIPGSSFPRNAITLVEIGSYRIPVFIRGNVSVSTQEQSGAWIVSPARLHATLRLYEPLPSFTIVAAYRGSSDLKNVALRHNASLLSVSPASFKAIKVNESITFNVSVKQRVNGSRNEEVSFGIGNETYALQILIEALPLTNVSNSSNASNNETLPYCSQLSGIVCRSDDVCSSSPVASRDGRCCLAVCSPPEQKSKVWIGYLLVGILLLIGIIAWVKYKKPAARDPLHVALYEKPHP